MAVGTLEEIIDDNHAIVSTSVGSEYYVNMLSFVDKDLIEPGCTVLLNNKVYLLEGREYEGEGRCHIFSVYNIVAFYRDLIVHKIVSKEVVFFSFMQWLECSLMTQIQWCL